MCCPYSLILGGAVLRSKTADFERLLDQTKKSRVSSVASTMPTAMQPNLTSKQPTLSSANVTNISISMAPRKKESISSDLSSIGEPKRGPIYKRQELISSVQNRSTKK